MRKSPAHPDRALAVVQRVVETVGADFGGSTGVVDREFNVLACGDGGWSASCVVAQGKTRLRHIGGFASLRPVWLPADPTLAAPGTLWVPLRWGGRLLGFLWLVHCGGSLSREEETRAERAARDIAVALNGLDVEADVLMQELLGPDAGARQQAVRRLVGEQGDMPDAGAVALVAASVAKNGRLQRPSSAEEAVRDYRFRRLAEDHVAVIVPGGTPDLDALANGLATQLRAIVGIGQWYPHLRFAHETYQEALSAVRVAARLTELGPVVAWTALGVYRTFAHLPEGLLSHSSVHPALERLFTEPAHQPLLATLETYLDLAGNVPLAAQRLHLHRASLYHRLRRVEQLLQADLRDGTQRLCLHVAFKLGRFTGRYPCHG